MDPATAKRWVLVAMLGALALAAARDLSSGGTDKVRGGVRSYVAIGAAGAIASLVAEVAPVIGAFGAVFLLSSVAFATVSGVHSVIETLILRYIGPKSQAAGGPVTIQQKSPGSAVGITPGGGYGFDPIRGG